MKKFKIITIFIIFVLSFIFHFGYTTFPNILFSVIFPVNESIWEHMKIISTSILVGSIIEYFLLVKNNIKFNNFLISTSISIICGIIIYLIIYLPLEYIFSHSLILAVTILFITFIISENIKHYIMKLNKIKYQNIIGIILITLTYFTFIYLTYNPIKNNLFIDTECNCYGIKN